MGRGTILGGLTIVLALASSARAQDPLEGLRNLGLIWRPPATNGERPASRELLVSPNGSALYIEAEAVQPGGPWKVVARKDALVVDPADLARARQAAAELPASLRTGAGDAKKLSPTSSTEVASLPDLNLGLAFKSDEPGRLASKRDMSFDVAPGLYADDVDAATREKVNAFVAAMMTILDKAKAAPTPPAPPPSFEMKRTVNGESTDLSLGANGDYAVTKAEGDRTVTVRGKLSAQELADFAKDVAAFTKEAKPGDSAASAPPGAEIYTLAVDTSHSSTPLLGTYRVAKGSYASDAIAKPASDLLALLDGFVAKYGDPAPAPAATRGIANLIELK
jgi:hypothetical protein